jgi:hypothetical protein
MKSTPVEPYNPDPLDSLGIGVRAEDALEGQRMPVCEKAGSKPSTPTTWRASPVLVLRTMIRLMLSSPKDITGFHFIPDV